MMPPVGKSGPLTHFNSDFDFASGLSIRCSAASHSSATLCGGIEVAMPTAMPCAPLASRFGKPPGITTGSLRLAVVIGAELDAVLVDAIQQQLRDRGHARFGVAVGGRVIAVDIAEIALAVDQRVARGEILRQPHHGVVDRLVAMRMERAHHVADDFCGFLEGRAGIEIEEPHAIEDAPVHRLQPVAGVRQRAMHDGRERIGEIALFQRIPQHHLVDFGRLFRR